VKTKAATKNNSKQSSDENSISLQNKFQPLSDEFGTDFQSTADHSEEGFLLPTAHHVKLKPRASGIRKRPATKRKVSIYSDSHGRGIAGMLNDINGDQNLCFDGSVKPGAEFKDVVNGCENIGEKFTGSDFMVLLGGTLDIYHNKSNCVIETLKQLLPKLSHTNVIVCHLPYRYDLPTTSCVNIEIGKVNALISKICQSFKNVWILNIGKLDRRLHTTHGLHLNKQGKRFVSNEIIKVLKKVIPIASSYSACVGARPESNSVSI
jgi:hypothetical protein